MKGRLRDRKVLFCAAALILGQPFLRANTSVQTALGPVDFRYSPPNWQTSVCLPDDPDKALVGKDGEVLLDYGVAGLAPGTTGERNFAIALRPDVADGSKWIRQAMVSPRVPIVQTSRDAGGVLVNEETFIETPEPGAIAVPPRLSRVDLQITLHGLPKPARECSPAFTAGAFDRYAPIHFQLSVVPGAKVTVVYGLRGSSSPISGPDAWELSAEGGEKTTVEPARDFGEGRPGVYRLAARDLNHDGVIDIYARPSDPKGVLNAVWAYAGAVPPDDAIIGGRADGAAIAAFPASFEPPRRAVVVITLTNTNPAAATRQAVLRIRSVDAVTLDARDQVVCVGDGTRICGSAPLTLVHPDENGEYSALMPAVTLPPGGSREFVFAITRNTTSPAFAPSPGKARALRAAAVRWWESYDLPYTTIQVPDGSIQEMLDSCVRNIWQARELKVGGPAFQVGPTCYRGLWVVDGSFILEAAAMLGRGSDARSGVEYLIGRQKPDGSFEELPKHWKENGIVLWAASRHALLTQDKDWLRRHWPALQRVMGAIRRMRESVSKDPLALNYRLLPGGLVDGGILNIDEADPEYSNILWTLAGIKSYIAAARWLGDDESAGACQKEYDDFYAAFRRACARDALKDGHGNPYVPTMMGDSGRHVPQKGQWAFCHAVYPGQVFPKDDPIMEGQLAMLRATKVEGMVLDTGWMAGGIWTYFASFYGHAQLWQGRGREAAESLYAFAQHACPMRVWREEQKPVGRGSDEVGDMPHNWASAEFVRLAIHLIELDRGDELHLLEGFPREWAGPGMVTRLNGALTPFGPLHLEVRVANDGLSARVKMGKLAGRPAKIRLHLDGLAGKEDAIDLPTDRDVDRSVDLAVPAYGTR